MIFLDKNKEKYNWDNSDIDYNSGIAEFNHSPLNVLPAELPGIDLETDNTDTSVVTPEINQSNVERIYKAKTNSFLIPEGNTSRSAGVPTLVDKTPL